MGGESKSAGDVGAEFDGDTQADDEVDEGDSVERDICEGHDTDDVDDSHAYCESDDDSGWERAKKDGREDKDYGESGAEKGTCKADD